MINVKHSNRSKPNADQQSKSSDWGKGQRLKVSWRNRIKTKDLQAYKNWQTAKNSVATSKVLAHILRTLCKSQRNKAAAVKPLTSLLVHSIEL